MSNFNHDALQRIPIIGILRGIESVHLMPIVEAYLEAGFTTLEVTMNTKDADALIQTTVKKFGNQLNIGAGTVRTMEELQTALDAGAQFIVTPILSEEVIAFCHAQKIPVFPGAYTPTEVYCAWSLGATAVKIFPATTGGLNHIKALKGPLDHIPMIPTGGVNPNNLAQFFDVGIFGVGMGSQLFPKHLLAERNWHGLKTQLSKTYSAYQSWKNSQI